MIKNLNTIILVKMFLKYSTRIGVYLLRRVYPLDFNTITSKIYLKGLLVTTTCQKNTWTTGIHTENSL